MDLQFVEEDSAPFWIYEKPDPGELYVIGADFQEGRERTRGAGALKAASSDSPDWNAMSVAKVSTGEEVATYMSHYAPFLVAQDFINLGLYYGPVSGCKDLAFGVLEINGPGLAVIEKVREYGYPKLFVTRRWLKFEDRFEQAVGWRTDDRTRPVMLQELQKEVYEQNSGVNCLRTVMHMWSMRYGRTGKGEAPAGEHDDLAFARMMAIQGRRVMMGVESDISGMLEAGPEDVPGQARDRTDRMWQRLAESSIPDVDSEEDEWT